jgi:carboxylesterase type B
MQNATYYATNFKSLCPTHLNTYQKRTSEDCLFLNIWVPDNGAKKMPVLLVIFDDGAHDWSINPLSGLDLASQGIIVVVIQYRINALGWFSLKNERAPGNLALLDQKLAINWITDNINYFGGDPNRLVILGHGSIATYCVVHHLTSPQTKRMLCI